MPTLAPAYPLLPLTTGRAKALLWSWLATSWPVPVAGVSRFLVAREAVSAWRQLDDAPQLFLALGILADQSATAGEAAASRAALDEGRRREDPQWPPRLRHRFAYHASHTSCLLGDVEAYRVGVREELALAEAAGADYAASLARYRLADAALMAGDVEDATTLGYAVVEEQRTRFARSKLGAALSNLCGALLMRDDLEAARMAAREAWPEMVATGGFGYLLAHLALLGVRLDRFEAAAQMLGRIDAWSEATQNSLESEARSVQLAVEGMAAVLQAEELAELRAAGRLLSEEQTEALVQSVLESQPHAGPAGE